MEKRGRGPGRDLILSWAYFRTAKVAEGDSMPRQDRHLLGATFLVVRMIKATCALLSVLDLKNLTRMLGRGIPKWMSTATLIPASSPSDDQGLAAYEAQTQTALVLGAGMG